RTLAEGVVEAAEQDRFLEVVQRAGELSAKELSELTFTVSSEVLARAPKSPKGLF
ncbi:MmgE/PrpD family protein, partial [Nocardia sp. NPDC004722]